MTSQIQGWRYAYPDEEHWAGWCPGPDVGAVARTLSGRLAVSIEGRALLQRSVEAVNGAALAKGGTVGTAGVWVPDRESGEVKGVLMAMRHGFVDSREALPEGFVARDWRRDYGGRRMKITERSAEMFECPAGRGVVETIVGRIRGERTVQAYSSFVVFPADGTPEVVFLTLNTVHLDLLVELTVLGRTIANSLEITTGPAAS